MLIDAGVPCGPINTIAGGVAAGRASWAWTRSSRSASDAVPTVRNPIRFSATPPSYRLPPPALDEHGAEVRAWLSRPREGDGRG